MLSTLPNIKTTPDMCLKCKGSRYLCGYKPCPLMAGFYQKQNVEKKVSENFFGSSNSIFVGREGYPNVFMGPTAPISQTTTNPTKWFTMSYQDIIDASTSILRTKLKEGIKSSSRFVHDNQLLSLAKSPTDVEMNFSKKPVYEFNFSPILNPMGPSAQIKKFQITENIKIERKVEYIVSDELKATDAAFKLYNNQQDIYKIIDILSSGSLGLKENKKLVPTRWSITGIDDIIGKQIIQQIKSYPSINEYLVFSSKFLSNHFQVLLMPGSWEFENFEAWAPGSTWAQQAKDTQIIEEYESYKGRTAYADKQVGGYYAARLAILEGMKQMKRQARVISFREISEGYVIPVGVWQVRENVRNAMQNPPKKFSTLCEALAHISQNLKIPLDEYRKQSRLLQQKRLADF